MTDKIVTFPSIEDQPVQTPQLGDNTQFAQQRGLRMVNGQAVVDAQGIVSTAAFPNGYANLASTQTTTSNTYADISGMSLTFSLPRTCNVLIGGSSSCEAEDVAANQPGVVFAFTVDDVRSGFDMSLYMSGVTDTKSPVMTISTSFIHTIAAGSHTLKMTWRTVNGGATTTAKAYGGTGSEYLTTKMYYVVLGS